MIEVVAFQPEPSDSAELSKLRRAFGFHLTHTTEWEDALKKGLPVVALETGVMAVPLGLHQEHLPGLEESVILVGPKNGTLPWDCLEKVDHVVQIETPLDRALAPSVALGIYLYTMGPVSYEPPTAETWGV